MIMAGARCFGPIEAGFRANSPSHGGGTAWEQNMRLSFLHFAVWNALAQPALELESAFELFLVPLSGFQQIVDTWCLAISALPSRSARNAGSGGSLTASADSRSSCSTRGDAPEKLANAPRKPHPPTCRKCGALVAKPWKRRAGAAAGHSVDPCSTCKKVRLQPARFACSPN